MRNSGLFGSFVMHLARAKSTDGLLNTVASFSAAPSAGREAIQRPGLSAHFVSTLSKCCSMVVTFALAA